MDSLRLVERFKIIFSTNICFYNVARIRIFFGLKKSIVFCLYNLNDCHYSLSSDYILNTIIIIRNMDYKKKKLNIDFLTL